MQPESVARAPYLSVVVAARNDNHGGNMLIRMQAMLNSWIAQAENYELALEIIVVEWNPPADRPRLKDALKWPARLSCDVRFIEVPADVHATFRNSAAIPLHQMIAKNAGIRRARGEFVLATNLDIIGSAELIRFLARRELKHSLMYRIDRYDVAREIPADAAVDELLQFCASHRLRVFAREGDFRLSTAGARMLEAEDIVSNHSGIHFGVGWSAVECSLGERYRWVESEAELWIEPEHTGTCGVSLRAETGPSAGAAPVKMEILDDTGSLLAEGEARGRCRLHARFPRTVGPGRLLIRTSGRGLPLASHPRIVNLRVFGLDLEKQSQSAQDVSPWGHLEAVQTDPEFDWSRSLSAPSPHANEMKNAQHLHGNAAGDFTLLSRENWFGLRGYAEFPIWPMHVDYLLCYTAHHTGLREFILREPMRIYHVEHSTGAGWTPEGEQERAARIKRTGVPEMTHAYVARLVDFMRRYDAPVIFNRADWGCAHAHLPEHTVLAGT